MTKIWEQSEDEYTDARNLDMEKYLEFFLGVKTCESMAGRFPDIRYEILSDSPPHDNFYVGTHFVVSEKLKIAMEEFHVFAEFFPVRIIYNGEEYTERRYFECNILDCVDCFDHTRGKATFSKTRGFTDRIDKIKKLAIDEEKAAGHALFRIAKGAESIECVSDDLAARIEELRLTGMKFVDPDQWCC